MNTALKKWDMVKVCEVASNSENALATGPFGSSISSRFFQDYGVPVIRGSNLSTDIGTRLLEEGLAFLSNEKAEEFRRSTAIRGDLVFTCWGTVNQVGLIDKRSRYPKYVISNKQMKLSPDSQKADSLFLYYVFSSHEMSNRILAESIGSSVPGFNLGQLKSMTILLPPLPEQQAIAHVLGTLDDKIELNRQMNKTLESIARAIFKSWFIDFEPIPGLGPHKEWEDSVLGKIPRGWRVLELHNCVELIIDYRGKTPAKLGNAWSSFGIPAISAKNIKKGRLIKKDSMNLVSPELFDIWMKDRLALDDILMTSEAPLGELLYLSRNANFCLSQRVFGIRTKASVCDSSYLYHWLTTDEAQSQLNSRATGSTVSGIRQSELRKIKVMAPTMDVQNAASRYFKPVLQLIDLNEEASETLASLRDNLLPRLLSGEVRIKDADKIVSQVV